ncbi:hypothetical protein N798_11390 [Knoellia flava TL1]|uniref:Uncharacterized protein n=2 Tax=Knoellia flava TaxID=913969 RepID=A0A8H9FXB2_9MICO|nr:hypothetical protein [Knoellia flava]KGN30190.1 hypothetical protein N798_11390 [Knoellia flava TL1]GGB87048.1 hypothetical protein GCM10011314_28510 [Knoellia flava]
MSRFAVLPQPFVRPDVVAAGLSLRTMNRAVLSGELGLVSKNLYAVQPAWSLLTSWEAHRAMAEAAVRLTKDAIVSHASAAALLGLPHPTHPPDHVTMTVLDDVRTSRGDTWRRLHRGATPYEHIVIQNGAPRFIAARTVIDCARELHPRDALAIADGALRSGMVTHADLWAMRCHQRRWPKVTNANAVLFLADGRRENWLESASAWAAHRWGLPVGVPQVVVLDRAGRFVARPDVLWPDHGVAGEADGLGKYLLDGTSEESVRRRLMAEEQRQAGLTDVGFEVVRWTPHEAVDGSDIHARFMAAAQCSPTIDAELLCSCCGGSLGDCAVEAHLATWRRMLTKELAQRMW